MVERRSEKPEVDGSTPSLTTGIGLAADSFGLLLAQNPMATGLEARSLGVLLAQNTTGIGLAADSFGLLLAQNPMATGLEARSLGVLLAQNPGIRRRAWLATDSAASPCRMIGVMDATARINIDRRPADVFTYVMQVSNDVNWRTGVVEAAFTTETPVGVGTDGFDRVDINGRSAVSQWRVFEWEPGSHARWDLVSGPISGTGGYICTPDHDGGTDFALEAHIRPTGLYRLLGPIFGVMGRRQNRADVAKLKSILESS